MKQVLRIGATSGAIGARLLVIAAGLATSIIAARHLGPHGRGQYFALMTTAALVAQLGNLGLSSSNTFLAARNPALAWPLAANSLLFTFAVAALSVVVFAAAATLIADRLDVPRELVWCICIMGPSMLFLVLGSSILAALERFAAVNTWQIVNAVILLAMLGVCAAFDMGLVGFTLAATLAAVITATLLYFQLARNRTGRLAFRPDLLRDGFGYAFRAYAATLFAFLLQRFGVFFLAWRGAPAEIGQFSIAMQIYDVMLIIPAAMGMVVLPALIRQGPGGRASLKGMLVLTSTVMALACVVAALAGGTLIRLVFGDVFSPAYPVLLWLLPAIFFVSLLTVLSPFLVNERYPGALVWVWLIGVVVSCSAAALSVRSHGAVGAAAAQSIGSLVVLLGAMTIASRRPQPEPLSPSRRPG